MIRRKKAQEIEQYFITLYKQPSYFPFGDRTRFFDLSKIPEPLRCKGVAVVNLTYPADQIDGSWFPDVNVRVFEDVEK